MPDYKEPKEYLPHRAPMLLIDRVLEVTESGASALSTVDKSGALGVMLDENGELDSYFAIELIAQTIGIWNGYHNGTGEKNLGMLLGARDLKCDTRKFANGTNIHIDVNKVMFDGTLASFEGKISSDRKVLAHGTINVISLTEQMKEKLFNRK